MYGWYKRDLHNFQLLSFYLNKLRYPHNILVCRFFQISQYCQENITSQNVLIYNYTFKIQALFFTTPRNQKHK